MCANSCRDVIHSSFLPYSTPKVSGQGRRRVMRHRVARGAPSPPPPPAPAAATSRHRRVCMIVGAPSLILLASLPPVNCSAGALFPRALDKRRNNPRTEHRVPSAPFPGNSPRQLHVMLSQSSSQRQLGRSGVGRAGLAPVASAFSSPRPGRPASSRVASQAISCAMSPSLGASSFGGKRLTVRGPRCGFPRAPAPIANRRQP